MNNKEINVLKSNGELVPFDSHKLYSALIRSGANKSEADEVVSEVMRRIKDRTKTSKIYKIAYGILKQKSHYIAGRYRLKKAVFDLGPSGYPFEKFVGKLMEYRGYQTEINQIQKGECVNHELDVVAENDKEKLMIECKFHQDKGRKNDVKIPLYIHSRFLDVKATWEQCSNKNMVGMVVTNTRFSGDATDYGNCVGLRLISWDYPAGNSLKDWVDQSGYHPITSIQSLSKKLKQIIMKEGIVLCRELINTPEILSKIGLSISRKNDVIREAEAIVLGKVD